MQLLNGFIIKGGEKKSKPKWSYVKKVFVPPKYN